MANKGKRKQVKQAINTGVPNSNATEYDVKERIRKFHSYNSRKQNGYSASTNSFSNLENSPSGRVVNSNVSISTPTDTGSLYNEYTRLDDKITNYSNLNELAHNDLRLAHNDLRKELENKIEKAKGDVENSINNVHDLLKDKLSYKWFAAAVAVLVAIAGIIYKLSYARQADDVEKSAIEISNIKQENSKMQKDIEYIKRDLEEIDQRNTINDTCKK